jgi:hypothetical protein
MTPAAPFLDALQAAADRAAAEENKLRREAAERIKSAERERGFAFRRLNLMRAVAPVAGRAETEELAVAHGLAVLQAKLGWSEDSEARSTVLSQFAPVAKAIYAAQPERAAPDADVAAALAAFEAWYLAAHGVPFLDLFDRPLPDMPVVDF